MKLKIQTSGLAIILCLLFVSCNVQADPSPTDVQTYPEDFPKSFISGRLNWNVDCLNFQFKKNKTFVYKFTGDCKGWGRRLHGTWSKGKDRILLKAVMREGPSQEHDHCAGSYYHANTPKQKATCIKKYKKWIRSKYGVYPAILEVRGSVRLNKKSEGMFSLETFLINNPKKPRLPGLLRIKNDSFGKFVDLVEKKPQ